MREQLNTTDIPEVTAGGQVQFCLYRRLASNRIRLEWRAGSVDGHPFVPFDDTVDETVGETLAACVVEPRDGTLLHAHLERALAGTPSDVTVSLLLPDGAGRRVRDSLTPIAGRDGSVDWLFGATRAIKSDAERAFAPDCDLETIVSGLDAMDYGIALWDSDDRLLFVNRKFQDFYEPLSAILRPGIPYAEFLRHLAESNELVTGSSRESWIAQCQSNFRTDAVFEQCLADGRFLEVRHSVTSEGVVMSVVQDVTALKRGERALRQAKEFADAADKTKSRFLRAANHDLRQPLATLKILIYNCMTAEDERDRQDVLHAMDVSVSIMEDLLGALLNIGQLDAGQIVPRVGTFQVSRLLERLHVTYRHQAEEKGLTLRIVNSSAAISSDIALLERIVSNFVSNAIRYTEVGTILIGCRRRGNLLRIEVWDTGRGMSEQDAARVFEEFYQVPDAKRTMRKGLGLGLSIARRVADLLHHDISVRSTPGKGSVFRVDVPLGDVWQSEIGEPEITEMIGGEFSDINVLIVEDDEILRAALQELLERWGISTRAVNSFEAARLLLENGEFRPGLIIADYQLRGQEYGTQVVDSIRAHIDESIPCIIVTANTDPGLIEKVRSGGYPVLIKPVSPPRLRVMMHNLIYEPDLLSDENQ